MALQPEQVAGLEQTAEIFGGEDQPVFSGGGDAGGGENLVFADRREAGAERCVGGDEIGETRERDGMCHGAVGVWGSGVHFICQ